MATPETTLPLDPNVRMPDSVKAAGMSADELHARVYAQQQNPEPVAPQPQPEPQPQPQPEPVAQVQPEPQPAPQPQNEPQPAPAARDPNVTAEEWHHRFLSMQGRYNAATKQMGAMEQQLQELGAELVRTQNVLASLSNVPAPQPQPGQIDQNHGNLITDADVEGYGPELIDLARRAAIQALSPELQRLHEENERLTRRVQSTGKRELFAALDAAVPDWRAINKNANFLRWLRLPNVYTGQLRGEMLKAAVNGAEAPKAIAIFRDFIAEATATGALAPAQQDEPAPLEPPRTPAVPLEQLAAPGRPRPASGETQVPSEKPIYSRAQISKFYDEKRRGMWAGRETEANAIEQDLIAAQSQGRIR